MITFRTGKAEQDIDEIFQHVPRSATMDGSLVLRKMNLHERFGLPAIPLCMHSDLHQQCDQERDVLRTATVMFSPRPNPPLPTAPSQICL